MGSLQHHDAYQLAAESARELASFTGVDSYDVALTLGSGWSHVAERLGRVLANVPAHEITGFRGSAVEGHTGMLQAIELANGKRMLVFAGRTHLYEGHGVDAVVHGIRVAAAAGCRAVVLTNGAGGLGSNLSLGMPMLISDHLNLTARSPLTGARFIDMTDAYSADARARVLTRLQPTLPGLTEGVYAQVPGPQYETPAEIRYLRTIGADAVGMSTALETIAAREAGMRVLGISLITNLAAGMADASGEVHALDHAEVLAAGAEAAPVLSDVLAVAVEELLA